MPFKIIEFNSFCFTLKEPKESPSHIPPPKNTVDPSIHPFVPAFQMVLATAKVVAKVTPKHQSQRRKPSNGSVVERARNQSVWGMRLVKKLWGLQTCANHSNLFKSNFTLHLLKSIQIWWFEAIAWDVRNLGGPWRMLVTIRVPSRILTEKSCIRTYKSTSHGFIYNPHNVHSLLRQRNFLCIAGPEKMDQLLILWGKVDPSSALKKTSESKVGENFWNSGINLLNPSFCRPFAAVFVGSKAV